MSYDHLYNLNICQCELFSQHIGSKNECKWNKNEYKWTKWKTFSLYCSDIWVVMATWRQNKYLFTKWLVLCPFVCLLFNNIKYFPRQSAHFLGQHIRLSLRCLSTSRRCFAYNKQRYTWQVLVDITFIYTEIAFCWNIVILILHMLYSIFSLTFILYRTSTNLLLWSI